MTSLTATPHRLDLHNSSVSFAAAAAGYCGFLHVASGGICMRPARHAGACQLQQAPSHLAGPTHSDYVSADGSADARHR
jgi:hypothetical protein